MFYAPLGEGNHNEWQMRREDTLIMLISIAPIISTTGGAITEDYTIIFKIHSLLINTL